jgi:outer membrane protein TolC
MTLLLAFFLVSADTLNLSLDDALKTALANSPTRIEAVLDGRTGTSNLVKGLTALLPTVGVSASYAATRHPYQSRTWSGSIGLNQVVFDVDIFGNVVQSKMSNDFYHQKAQDENGNLIYSVKSGYFTLSAAYNLYANAQSALRNASASYDLTQEKFRLGQVSKIDVLRTEAFKSQAQIDLLTAEKNLKIANEDFKGQLGIIKDVLIKPITEFNQPAVLENEDFDLLWNEVYKNNAGLNMTRKTEQIARLSFLQAIGKIFPQVSYYIQNEYSDSIIPKNLTGWQSQDITYYGLRFNFPIFELKSLIQNIYDSKLAGRRATVERMKAELTLRKTATDAFLSFQEARQRYDFAQKNLELNQQLYDLAMEQFRLGSLSLLDLFTVELNLSQARTTYITSIADTYTSKALLDYLLGSYSLEVR